LRIAILHYHFDPGGVTRVVTSTVEAFRDKPEYRFGILSGRSVGGFDLPCEVIPELDYSIPGQRFAQPDALHSKVIAAAKTLFDGKEPDVWHIHNPALGKNAAFSGLIVRLAREGRALLLHEHDFAEDFRPANHRLREQNRSQEDPAFPFSRRVAYGVLNARDHSLLIAAGLPPALCHLLPNPIYAGELPPPPESEADILLYPVRALARKNLGEFLLLCLSLKTRFRFETSLPPTNPSYLPQFREWKELAAKYSLPVRLGAEEHESIPFADRMSRCRAVVTTSLAEGFGLGFLEPWIFNRPVVGRDLPEITSSFIDSGVQLDHLYRKYPVPREACSGNPSERWRSALIGALNEFGVPPDQNRIAETEDTLFDGIEVDFGLLCEADQAGVIRAVAERKIPVTLPFDPEHMPDQSAVTTSAKAVCSTFDPDAYCRRLAAIYKTIAEAPTEPIESVDTQMLLTGFLHPARFRPHFFPTP